MEFAIESARVPPVIQGTPELARAIREAPIAAFRGDPPVESYPPSPDDVKFAIDRPLTEEQKKTGRMDANGTFQKFGSDMERKIFSPTERTERVEQEVLSARLATERQVIQEAVDFCRDELSCVPPVIPVAAPAQKGCLTPGCGNKIRSRGLCQNCYSAARLRVNSGVSTWEDLENSGLALPSKKKGSVESSAAFEAAFKAAQERQAAEACVHAEAEKSHAAIAAPGPERTVESFSTQDDIRNAALAVSNNPCQQNLDILASVQARLRPLESPELSPAGRTYVSTPQEEPNPYLHNLQPPAVYPPQDLHQTPDPVTGLDPHLSKLPDGMVWEQGPSGMVARAKTDEEFLIEERKVGQQKSRKLRLQSREDCRVDKDHEVLEDQGDLDNTGMSDEEFDRIKTAHGIRTGTIAPPLSRVQSISERRKPAPQFAEPPLPIPENTPCDPTLGQG